MKDWIAAKLAERSTKLGLIALGLGTVLLTSAFLAPPERYPNVESAIQWIGQLFMVGGLAGVIFPEKKP